MNHASLYTQALQHSSSTAPGGLTAQSYPQPYLFGGAAAAAPTAAAAAFSHFHHLQGGAAPPAMPYYMMNGYPLFPLSPYGMPMSPVSPYQQAQQAPAYLQPAAAAVASAHQSHQYQTYTPQYTTPIIPPTPSIDTFNSSNRKASPGSPTPTTYGDKKCVFQIACLYCRQSHRKCSKTLPVCKECAERNLECTFPRPKNKRGLTKMIEQNGTTSDIPEASVVEVAKPRAQRKESAPASTPASDDGSSSSSSSNGDVAIPVTGKKRAKSDDAHQKGEKSAATGQKSSKKAKLSPSASVVASAPVAATAAPPTAYIPLPQYTIYAVVPRSESPLDYLLFDYSVPLSPQATLANFTRGLYSAFPDMAAAGAFNFWQSSGALLGAASAAVDAFNPFISGMYMPALTSGSPSGGENTALAERSISPALSYFSVSPRLHRSFSPTMSVSEHNVGGAILFAEEEDEAVAVGVQPSPVIFDDLGNVPSRTVTPITSSLDKPLIKLGVMGVDSDEDEDLTPLPGSATTTTTTNEPPTFGPEPPPYPYPRPNTAALYLLTTKFYFINMFINIFYNYAAWGLKAGLFMPVHKMRNLLEVDFHLQYLEYHCQGITDPANIMSVLSAIESSPYTAFGEAAATAAAAAAAAASGGVGPAPTSAMAAGNAVLTSILSLTDPLDLAALYAIEARCLQYIGKCNEARIKYEKCNSLLSERFFKLYDPDSKLAGSEDTRSMSSTYAASAMVMMSVYLLGEAKFKRAKWLLHNAKYIIMDSEGLTTDQQNSYQLEVIKEYFDIAQLLQSILEENGYMKRTRVVQQLLERYFTNESRGEAQSSSSSITSAYLSSSSAQANSQDARLFAAMFGAEAMAAGATAQDSDAPPDPTQGQEQPVDAILKSAAANDKYAAALSRLISIHYVMRAQFHAYINREYWRRKHGEKQFHMMDLVGFILCEGLKLERLHELKEYYLEKQRQGLFKPDLVTKNLTMLDSVIASVSNDISLKTCSPYFPMCSVIIVDYVILAAQSHFDSYLVCLDKFSKQAASAERSFLLERKILCQWLVMDLRAIRTLEYRFYGCLRRRPENTALIYRIERVLAEEGALPSL